MSDVTFLKTKQLADLHGITALELRRVLRSMPRYNDGVQTHYLWNPTTDKAILDEIATKVAAYKAKRQPQATAPAPAKTEPKPTVKASK